MSQRRRGGFRGPELRGTLGTLLRSTLEQAGVVRDALERGAREGKSRLDDARHNRRRHDALAELGAGVLELIRNDEIDVSELPELRGIVRELDELDALDDAPAPRRGATPPSRSRFDDRRPSGTADDDGTVASALSSAARGTLRAASAAAARVWRPPADQDAEPHAAEPPRARVIPEAQRKGGISFDDDSDLAEYMHPDDVPPRGSSGPKDS